MTSEQIQALKAAIDDATQGSWVNESGEGCEAICCDDDQGNAGFIIAEFQGKDATANRKYVQAANPAAIRSLLAERDADKELIADLEQKHCGGALIEREEHHVGVVNKLLERIAELEGALNLASASYAGERERADALQARTLAVKLPKLKMLEDYLAEVAEEERRQIILGVKLEFHRLCKEATTAAGITLDVGE